VTVSRRGEIVEMRSMDVCAPMAKVG
jgi:hypothetical protein